MPTEALFIFVLLAAFQIKHFAGDYVFQTTWMVTGKSRPDRGFILPLSMHVLVHTAMTFGIVWLVNPKMWWLAIVDFVAHFTMDRIKASPHLLGRFNDPTKSSFWIPFGFDQVFHHFTHYAIIWMLFADRFGY